MNYEKDAKHKGMLALKEGTGLEQIYIGAEALKKELDAGIPVEDAIIQFYPLNPPRSSPKDWRKDPMRRSWTEQVLGDIQFYRNNGLDLTAKDAKGGPKNRLPAILQPLVPVVGAQAASKIAELPPDSQAAILEDELLGDAPEIDDENVAAMPAAIALDPAASDSAGTSVPEGAGADSANPQTAPVQPPAPPAPEQTDTAEETEIIDLNEL